MTPAARCDRFDREGVLLLERGEPLGDHFNTCPDCRDLRRRHARLASALASAPATVGPRPGWEQRVLAATRPALFGAVLRPAAGPKFHVGAGLVLAACALLMVLATRRPTPPEQGAASGPGKDLRFVTPPPPRPLSPPPNGPAEQANDEKPGSRSPQEARKLPPREEKTPEDEHAAGTMRGVVGGVPGGVVGGAVGGVVGEAPPAPPVLPFDASMTRPTLVSGPEAPQYSREALEAKVEGKVLATCVLETDGSLQRCRIVKSLPFLDEAVLATLAQQRYTPVIHQGRKQAVQYIIPFKFKLP